MGLDMYWLAKKTSEEKAEALITGEDPYKSTELGYFRKFYSLNEYMGDMYPEEIEDFNTVELVIEEHELAMMRAFTPTEEPNNEEELEDQQDDMRELSDICDKIEEALKEGREVFYWPWW